MSFVLERLQTELKLGGLGAALRFLNGPVSHRYTGVYRLRDGLVRNVGLADKQREFRPESLMEVPLGDSFCQFVLREGTFKTGDSAQDQRLAGNRFQGVVVAYHGVPLLDTRGEFYGTLCHFDMVRQDLDDPAFDLLMQASRLITGYLPR